MPSAGSALVQRRFELDEKGMQTVARGSICMPFCPSGTSHAACAWSRRQEPFPANLMLTTLPEAGSGRCRSCTPIPAALLHSERPEVPRVQQEWVP